MINDVKGLSEVDKQGTDRALVIESLQPRILCERVRVEPAGPPRCDVIGSRDVVGDVTNRFCPFTFLQAPNSKQPHIFHSFRDI